MALATVSTSGVGAFLMQTASLGQVTVANTTPVQQLLDGAQAELAGIDEDLLQYHYELNTGDVDIDLLYKTRSKYAIFYLFIIPS